MLCFSKNVVLGFALALVGGCGGAARTPTAAAPMVAAPPTLGPASAKAPASEVYIGVVGMLPVRATLTRTADRLEGRWVYEERGSAEGLVLEGKEDPKQKDSFEVVEKTVAGEVTGKVWLQAHGAALEGRWEKPGSKKSLDVALTKEVRVREGQNAIRARRILVKKVDPPMSPFAAFVPEAEGPMASKLGPNLALEKLAGIGASDLGAGVTALGFEVVYDDAEFVTLAVNISTMGAYPDSHMSVASFAWATGARIGRDAFLSAKRDELVRVLDRRVHDGWRVKKEELMKGPNDETSCGPRVANEFMSGSGPSVSADILDRVFVTAAGIDFDFDMALPHVVKACSPTADLHLTWSELDPAGVSRGE